MPSRAIQSTCTMLMPPAYQSAVCRPSGWPAAARSHRPTIAKRMMAYPSTTVTDWPSSKMSGTPAARNSAPTMITKVSSRKTTSSLS